MLNELINASQALLESENFLNIMEYSSNQNEYDRAYQEADEKLDSFMALCFKMFPDQELYYDYIHNAISELYRQYDCISIDDITIYDADELYNYCVDAGMFEDNEYLESAISWIPENDVIEWYTLNVLTEYNGLDLTRLGANYLMMIHYSK